MSKMVSVRLSDELAEWVDAQEGSRSEVIVRGLEALRSPVPAVASVAEQAERSIDPSELEERLEVLKGQARPGVRIAMMCDHKDCVPPYRRFFETEEQAAEWSCPDHGRAVRQGNQPYLGVPT